MIGVLKYVGAAAVLGCAYLAARRYRKFLLRRVEECESFLKLIEHIKGEISCFLSPVGEVLSNYCDEALSEVGLLTGTAQGMSLYDAYKGCEGKLSVGDEAREILERLFSELGKKYKNETVAALGRAEETLSAYTARVKDRMRDDMKLAAALIFGGAMGLLLLLL